MKKLKYVLYIIPNIIWAISLVSINSFGPQIFYILNLYVVLISVYLLYNIIDFVFIKDTLIYNMIKGRLFKNMPISISALNIGLSTGLLVISLSKYYSFEVSLTLLILSLASIIITIVHVTRYYRNLNKKSDINN